MTQPAQATMNKTATRTLKESHVDNSSLIRSDEIPAKVERPIHKHPIIAEGLRRNDLKNLVSDVVNITVRLTIVPSWLLFTCKIVMLPRI